MGVDLEESLMHGIASGRRKVAAHSTQEFVEAQFAITVLVEVFEALGNLQLHKRDAERVKGIAELLRVEGSTAIFVELFEYCCRNVIWEPNGFT